MIKKGLNELRKYIDDLGIKLEDTPQGWCPGDSREEGWSKQREIYGFDSRETWSLDYTFKLWLYERLRMYDEVNVIDTGFHKFDYKGKLITFQECIDRMIEGLRLDLTLGDFSEERKIKEIDEKIEDVMPIFCLCHKCLWW
ncbi:hypothetical protein F4V43_02015 [Paenibacillus spiritus]|uniref:Uncharacterized protein n=1 Tax=Paenibacillus spiritus TaxID=2496557 RepID=A0A5J5GGL2_9BACL|nr:hypothetical protein [Paenibacillus spiritus]KAA9007285.1 hypothetical protein F4V43_02015 [Paenibacillus spiritus]